MQLTDPLLALGGYTTFRLHGDSEGGCPQRVNQVQVCWVFFHGIRLPNSIHSDVRLGLFRTKQDTHKNRTQTSPRDLSTVSRAIQKEHWDPEIDQGQHSPRCSRSWRFLFHKESTIRRPPLGNHGTFTEARLVAEVNRSAIFGPALWRPIAATWSTCLHTHSLLFHFLWKIHKGWWIGFSFSYFI